MSSTTQLTEDDLKTMTPDAIDDARLAGRCDALLGVPPEDVALLDRARHGTDPLNDTDVERLSALGRHELILTAAAADRITY